MPTDLACASSLCWPQFIVIQSGGRTIDVTLRPKRGANANAHDGSYGSESLTVLNEATGAPTIFLKLGRHGVESAAGGVGDSAPPVQRQLSGYRMIQKAVKRWKPCLATELDRYLGEGSVRDRMLLVELLDVDDPKEMPEVSQSSQKRTTAASLDAAHARVIRSAAQTLCVRRCTSPLFDRRAHSPGDEPLPNPDAVLRPEPGHALPRR